MPDPEGFHLNRAGQAQLLELLDQIPDLVEDLAIAITKQTRMTNGLKVANGSDEQPLPFDENAAQAADELNHELGRWMTLTVEHRHLDGPHRHDTITLARWLKRWYFALSLTPGSEEAPHDIRLAIRAARQAIDRPRERPRTIDPTQIYEAGTTLLNARGIEHLARQLGDHFTNLNRRRVYSLRDAGKITPAAQVDGNELYHVGDVLAAHLAHPTRRKTA